jgi:hypothetical protein
MPWDLTFIGYYLLECDPTDPRCWFVDAQGQGWRNSKGRMLVQPDPEERGLPIHMTYPYPGEKRS